LEFATAGGPQKILCWNTEGIFRLIQSIPSPKAEPFKRWLARVGKERIDEIENPELAMARMQELYEKKGYPKEWIDKRVRGIAVRQDLTDEWQSRGVGSSLEFAILTNEIMQGAFGLKVDEYKQVKDLDRENLRDHMTDIELDQTDITDTEHCIAEDQVWAFLNTRVLWFLVKHRRIVTVHGIRNKGQVIPAGDLKIARERIGDWQKREGR
jgi:phage-related protein